MTNALGRHRVLRTLIATTLMGTLLTGWPADIGRAAAAATPVHPAAVRPDAAPSVLAYPGPGWTTASPRTSIVFRGASAAQLRPVRVIGTRTGVHAGALVDSRAGVGAVFEPTHPFAPGERVRVTAAEPVDGAGSRTYRFGVAVPVRAPLTPPDPAGPAASGDRTAKASRSGVHRCVPHVWRFHSEPDLHPVADCVMRRAVGTAPGLIFTTPSATSDGQHGPTIYDQQGNVVWYHPLGYRQLFDLSVVRYHRQRLLAFHVRHPRGRSGYRHASVLLLNEHYRQVARVTAHNGYEVDGHEFQVRGNDAWLGAYNPIIDPASGRPVYEYVVQKINIRTGDVLFEWHSLPQIKTSYSYVRPRAGKVWDYFHGNAIAPLRHGGFLLSARNTSAVYRISDTGKVVWTMGGKHDTFHLAARHRGWQFCFQHDVRPVGNHRLTVFDDGGRGPGCPEHRARVEEFAYHPATGQIVRTANYSSLAASSDGRGYRVSALGSARFLENGDLMVSWGTSGRITEFTPRHRVDFGLRLATKTYRAISWPWIGEPRARPAVAASRTGAHVKVWASWNGSTRVTSWQVLAGKAAGKLRPVGTPVRRTGFETRLRVKTRAHLVAVRAFDVHGKPLGHSEAIRPH